MIAGHQFGACLPTFGDCADRYCLSGYGGGGSSMEEMLDLALQVEGLDGLELVGNWHVNDDNIRDVARMFDDRGLKIPMLVPDLWTQAKWGKGSLAAPAWAGGHRHHKPVLRPAMPVHPTCRRRPGLPSLGSQ